MPTNANLPLQVHPAQMEDPMESYSKVLSVRSMIQQQQANAQQQEIGALHLSEQKRQATEGQQLRDLFKPGVGPDGQPTAAPDIRTALPKVFAINPTIGMSMQKSLHEQEKAALDLEKTKIETNGKKAERFGAIAGSIKDEPSFHQGIATALNEKLITAEDAQKLLAEGWDDKSQAHVQQIVQGAMNAKEQHDTGLADLAAKALRLEEQHKADMRPWEKETAQNNARKTGLEADELQRKLDIIKNTTPEQTMALVDQVVPPGVKENAQLNARTKSIVLARMKQGDVAGAQDAIKTAAAEMRQLEVATDPRVQAAKINVSVAGATGRADAGGLTDDDYKRSGQQYGLTGVMPPMGRDSVTRGRIEHAKNEWAKENGLSPQDMVKMQAAYAGDKESLKGFQKQRDQIVSFEQTAQKNLDLFLTAAAKIPDTGVPWLNLPIRSLDEKLVGSANMAAVNAARQVANNEIAKVTSGGGLGGVLSDSARHEVSAYNPKDATFAQTLAVAKVLKQDMANRHGSMDAMLGEIKTRIGGGAKPEGPAATHRYNPATGKIEEIK